MSLLGFEEPSLQWTRTAVSGWSKPAVLFWVANGSVWPMLSKNGLGVRASLLMAPSRRPAGGGADRKWSVHRQSDANDPYATSVLRPNIRFAPIPLKDSLQVDQ